MFDWERNWRAGGFVAVLFLVVAGVIYGSSPKVGASAEKLVSFYDGDRTRILIATVIFCIGFLNLLWFAAALSTDLRDAGKSGWGAAAILSVTERELFCDHAHAWLSEWTCWAQRQSAARDEASGSLTL